MYVAVVVLVDVRSISATSDCILRLCAIQVCFCAESFEVIDCSKSDKGVSFRFSSIDGIVGDGAMILQTTFTMPKSRRPPTGEDERTFVIVKLTMSASTPAPAASATTSLIAVSTSELEEKETGS